jgi:hypothetical protein
MFESFTVSTYCKSSVYGMYNNPLVPIIPIMVHLIFVTPIPLLKNPCQVYQRVIHTVFESYEQLPLLVIAPCTRYKNAMKLVMSLGNDRY